MWGKVVRGGLRFASCTVCVCVCPSTKYHVDVATAGVICKLSQHDHEGSITECVDFHYVSTAFDQSCELQRLVRRTTAVWPSDSPSAKDLQQELLQSFRLVYFSPSDIQKVWTTPLVVFVCPPGPVIHKKC